MEFDVVSWILKMEIWKVSESSERNIKLINWLETHEHFVINDGDDDSLIHFGDKLSRHLTNNILKLNIP